MKTLFKTLFFCSCLSTFAAAQQPATYAPSFLGKMPASLAESSGLVFHDGALWSINDGGNAAILYKMDSAAPYSILQTFVLENTTNIDWEALTQSDTHFFIGDFGNNVGDRKDLKILKIAKSDLNQKSSYPQADTIKNVETIAFEYPDQIYHKFTPNNTNFDCEAFIHYGDSLYLFTKNWKDNHTKVYSLPTEAGKYKAQFKQKHNIGFTLTDISIDKKHNNLILIGYHGRYGNVFAYTVTGFKGTDFFSGKTQKFDLPHLSYMSQIEGVTFFNGYSGWISSETYSRRTFKIEGTLHAFDLSEYFDNAKEDMPNPSLAQKERKIDYVKKAKKHKKPIIDIFEIELTNLKKGLWYIEYFSPNGVFLQGEMLKAKDEKLSIKIPEDFNAGDYIIKASTYRESYLYRITKHTP